MSEQTAEPQTWGPEHLRLAIEAACVALWSWNVDTNRFIMDQRSYDLWGLPASKEVEFETMSACIHPADRDRVRAAFMATRSVAGAYEIDFRIMHDREIRWISARGQGADAGIVDRTMHGIFLDVTGRKQTEESHELLAGEMSHRVKNLLAVAAGLTRITSRAAKTAPDLAELLIGRLMALGRAHDLVRPLPGHQGKAVLLGDLISVLLAPYDDGGAFAGRIRVAVPRMGVGRQTAETLALVIHELATNALKHGALSVPEGTLDVSSTAEGDDIKLIWAEDGGPEVPHAPNMRGFGSKLVARSIAEQLNGEMFYDWQPSGLVATLRMRKERLAV